LLLTVVFIPFHASLIDEYISTDHAAPAVVLYNSVLSLQAIAWILICQAALKNHLGKMKNQLQKFVKMVSLDILPSYFILFVQLQHFGFHSVLLCSLQ